MTNEQMRQRIAELEEGLRYLNTEIDAMWNDPEKRQIHEFYMQSITNAQIHAASLLTAPPPASEPESLHVHETCKENAVSFASEPDAGEVERVARKDLLPCPFCGSRAEWCTIEDGDDLGGSYIECTNSACRSTTRLEFGRKENLISMWNARAAMRPAIDREKLAEIRRAYDEWRGADTLCGLLADPEDEGSPKERQEAAEHAAWAWDQAAGKFMLYGDALLEMIGGLTDAQ